MLVDTPFELFTTLLGWLVYDTFWEILVGTGLIHLAFLSILLTSVIDAGPKGETDEGGTAAYKSVTLGMGIAMVVLFLAAQPFINIAPRTVEFVKPCSADAPVNAENSGTTYDQSFNGYLQTVQAPIWWAMIIRFSYGLNNTAKAALPCPNDLRLALSSFANVEIGSPDLTRDLHRFSQECFRPARATFSRVGVTPAIRTVLDREGVSDTEWMGSVVYSRIPGFYDEMYALSPVPGILFDPSGRGTDRYAADLAVRDGIALPDYGQPTCREWWDTKIQPALLDLVATPELEAASPAGIIRLLPRTQTNRIIRALIEKETIVTSGFAPRGVGADGEDTSLFRGGINLLTSMGLSVEQVQQEAEYTVIREALPFVKAILLMVIVLTLPFLYILGNFSLSTLAVATVGFITINFTSFFWHLAWVIDNQLLAAFFPDFDRMLLANIGVAPDAVKFKVIAFMVPMLYIVMPGAYLMVVSWAGYQVVSSNLLQPAKTAGGAGSKMAGGAAHQVTGEARKGTRQVFDRATRPPKSSQ